MVRLFKLILTSRTIKHLALPMHAALPVRGEYNLTFPALFPAWETSYPKLLLTTAGDDPHHPDDYHKLRTSHIVTIIKCVEVNRLDIVRSRSVPVSNFSLQLSRRRRPLTAMAFTSLLHFAILLSTTLLPSVQAAPPPPLALKTREGGVRVLDIAIPPKR